MSDRAFVEKQVMPFYKQINASATKNSNNLDQPFSEAKDIFMMAVGLGVQKGKRRELEGSKEGLFFWNRLSKDLELPALRVIALSETGNVESMQDEDLVQLIAEEYANEGIRILIEEVINQDGNALWNLVEMIREEN